MTPPVLKKIICKLVGHRYRVIKAIDPDFTKLKCKNCNNLFLKKQNSTIEPFPSHLEQAYEGLAMYKIKKAKKNQIDH